MPTNKKASTEEQTYRLNQYAEKGNLAQLKKLIEAGTGINACDSLTGFRPLISASAKGRFEIVEFLLSQGVKPDVRVKSDLPTDDRNATALMLAAHISHKRIVKLLLDAGADVNASTGGAGLSTPLEYAVQKGHLEMTRLLLQAGAKLTRDAINRAAMYGYLPVLKELLKNRIRKPIPFSPGLLPIVISIESVPKKRQMGVLSFVLAAGADINGEDAFGSTALRSAIKVSNVKLLRWLLEQGANVNQITKNGSTALHYAAFLGECECVRVLIEAGANQTVRNSEGKTPLEWAIFQGQKAAVKVLKHNMR